ncbi:MAG: 16S rRNA (guanine(527)-N(7))-methyltransferase RsmG [Candidatus Zixiibacteriota bacterium]|nr:MAG: 16S rRNA (guanine(527)-N(7))-methyltransferase RsmG [candidate division Zixibacteria bacterium]
MPLPVGSEEVIKRWFGDRGLEADIGFLRKTGLYYDLILEWSRRINLVSKNDLSNLLERHILDSLVPIKEIPIKGDLVDIGSGAGFPAIPIALVRPELYIVMVESRRKKVLFLNEVVSKLELPGVSVWNGRLEDYFPAKKYDIATIRAVLVTEKNRKHLRKIIKESGKIIYYNKFNEYKLL